MCRALLVASMCLLLASCGASPVRIRVTQLDGQQAGQPVRGARVRAVMLDAGTIPLPLNFDTLAEMLTKQETIAVTDRGGVARLALLRDRSQLIEVEGPLDFTRRAASALPEQADRLERIGALYARLRYGPGGDDDDPTGTTLERLIEEIGKRQ